MSNGSLVVVDYHRVSLSPDGVTWTTLAPLDDRGGRIESHVATAVDGVIYVGGTWRPEGADYLSDQPAIWKIDLSGDRTEPWPMIMGDATGPQGSVWGIAEVAGSIVATGGWRAEGSRTDFPAAWKVDGQGQWQQVLGQGNGWIDRPSGEGPSEPGLLTHAVTFHGRVYTDSGGIYSSADGSIWTNTSAAPHGLADYVGEMVVWDDQLVGVADASCDSTRLENAVMRCAEIWATSDGQTFTRHPMIGAEFGSYFDYPPLIQPVGDQLLVVALIVERGFADYCFDDASTCRARRTVVAVADRSFNWKRTSLPTDVSFSRILPGAPARVVGNDTSGSGGLWTWTGGAPVEGIDTTPQVARPGPPLLDYEVTQLQLGQTLRYEWLDLVPSADGSIACGTLESFNGKPWTLKKAPTSPLPAEWPIIIESGVDATFTYAFVDITLTRPDRIELSIEGRAVPWVFESTPEGGIPCSSRR